MHMIAQSLLEKLQGYLPTGLALEEQEKALADMLQYAAMREKHAIARELTKTQEGKNKMSLTPVPSAHSEVPGNIGLINPKIRESVFPASRGTISCGMHLTATLGDPNKIKPMASLFATAAEDEDTEGVLINTYLYVDPKTKKIKQSTDNKWLIGEQKTFSVDSYPESIQAGIIQSMNQVKGLFKKSTVTPIPEDEFDKLLGSDEHMVKIRDQLLGTFETMITQIQDEKKKYAGVGVEGFIDRYAFKKHIMIAGPKGAGKTYTVSNYCEENGVHTEFIAGHNGLESTDLLGYYVKNTSGALVWMDGPLSAAFRKAQTEPSVMFIDEILRIPARELNILIGALTPDSTKHYVLRTNRIVGEVDGMGKSETLRVPAKQLWAVATTNIGSDYDVDDMDLAFTDRFRTIDMTLATSTVATIIENSNDGKFDQSVLDRVIRLYDAVEALVNAKELTYKLNVRHLCEIIDFCDDPKELTSFFYDLTPNICSRTTDGDVNTVEENIYKSAIKKIM